MNAVKGCLFPITTECDNLNQLILRTFYDVQSNLVQRSNLTEELQMQNIRKWKISFFSFLFFG